MRSLSDAMQQTRISVKVTVLVFVLFALLRLDVSVEADLGQEYQSYVHTFVNAGVLGNWTYVEKPMFPVFFNKSQIVVGGNWTVVCPLLANRSYHVYCYGEWVNNGSEPKTDYDVYVYDPFGGLVSSHTESAGLLEHLGSSVDEPFFVPEFSGNYSFVIRNDPRESKGAEAATFMIVEDVPCNVWHVHYAEGKDNVSLPVFETGWGYEFFTDSRRVEVWVRVPDSLDMYEVRIYLMANLQAGKGASLNGVPLAWELGLYGERTTVFGGYNLESKEYRGVGYASCEFSGQDMFLNFTSPYAGLSLYHLVFIGEKGSGTIDYLVKTEFGKARLDAVSVPQRVYPGDEVELEFVSNATDLVFAELQYSVDGWENVTSLSMNISNSRVCMAVIPGQVAGTVVGYRVVAGDVLENVLVFERNYSVKYAVVLNVSLARLSVVVGENVTVRGRVSPVNGSVPVTVTLSSVNATLRHVCYTFENGSFVASVRVEALGTWEVQVAFAEDEFRYGCASSQLTVKVEEPSVLVKYSLYIGGGVGAVAAVGVVVYLKKFRG
ncbi:hypothetical protein KEJ15_07395 [Candidatus Bathyarchaeota archaeon]|nr:hypothetical protein [Candidatus Bathyarchaeota archaeon]